ncbi:MAG: hypothetical protein JXD23_10360 [Spirochaetales bacterium]|nr:hypothetical protein [Spirochaetales bacterium]
METRDEVIKKIERAVLTEENAVQLYARHLKAIMKWSGLAKKDRAEIEETLNILIRDSHCHAVALRGIRERLLKGGGDV